MIEQQHNVLMVDHVTSSSWLDELLLLLETEGETITKQQLIAFVSFLFELELSDIDTISPLLVFTEGQLDQYISQQMDEILHHPIFQQIESFWRSFYLLVSRLDFEQNICLHMLHVTKEELLEDFEFAIDVTFSAYYQHVYSADYGQFGGTPIAAVIGNYWFNTSTHDIKLLHYLSQVNAMAHAPFLAGVAADFFGMQDVTEFSAVTIGELASLFEGAAHSKWRSLRQTEEARYLGLTTPRFLLRQPYRDQQHDTRMFKYNEHCVSHQHYVWGNSAFLLAICLAQSFARYGWCLNIIGALNGGAIKGLIQCQCHAMTPFFKTIPTEVLISDQREYELSQAGFIPLVTRKGINDVVFYSANSIQKYKTDISTKQGQQASINAQLGAQLPYLFIICRLAHHIKVLHREQIGSWQERQDIQRGINSWLQQNYVANQENPPIELRHRKPLRAAYIEVLDEENNPGWYLIKLTIQPHLKYLGANFHLSLVGRLDKE